MKKILVIDDELEMDFIFKAMLEDDIEKKQLCIDYFSNPKECLDFFLKHPTKSYDYVFSDINMPLLNGVQFVKGLRELQYKGPIAFISAYRKNDYSDAMTKFNVSHFFAKPLDFSEIRSTLGLS